MSQSELVLGLVSGIGLGTVYVLLGTSFTIVLQASGIFNLLFGILVSVGTVFAYTFQVSLGWSFLPTAVVTVVAGAVLGLISYCLAVWPLAGRTAHLGELGMITTLGLATAAQVVLDRLFGPNTQGVPNYVPNAPIKLGSIPIQPIYLAMTVVAIVLVVVMALVLTRSGTGRVMRASLEDPEGAAGVGINTKLVVAGVMCVSSALAMLVGLLLSPLIFASTYSGQTIMLVAFVAMGIGGFGSLKGVVAGSLIVGLIQAFVPIVTTPNAVLPVMLVLAIVVLTVRPVGLFGSAGTLGNKVHREV